MAICDRYRSAARFRLRHVYTPRPASCAPRTSARVIICARASPAFFNVALSAPASRRRAGRNRSGGAFSIASHNWKPPKASSLTWKSSFRRKSNTVRCRATRGPLRAARSGHVGSAAGSQPRVKYAGPRRRRLLPSWSCEFDSRHPLQWHNALSDAVSWPVIERGDAASDRGRLVISGRSCSVQAQVWPGQEAIRVGLPAFLGDHQPDFRAIHGPQPSLTVGDDASA
jgi:hypothetical protein